METCKGTTWVGSGPACQYQTRVEMTVSDKHSTLLRYGIIYNRKIFYDTVHNSKFY